MKTIAEMDLTPTQTCKINACIINIMKTPTIDTLTPIQVRKVEACILNTLRCAQTGSGKEWELTRLEVNQMEENLSSTEVVIEVCGTDKSRAIRYNYQGFVSRHGAITSYDHNKKMLCGRKALNNVSISHW